MIILDPPKFAPTKNHDENHEEFDWYRANFGELSGEEIKGLVEKPDIDKAPSTLSVVGRYIFP